MIWFEMKYIDRLWSKELTFEFAFELPGSIYIQLTIIKWIITWCNMWYVLVLVLISHSGIHEPPGPRTGRSDLVLDLLNFFGPGPVRSEIFQILLVLVRFGPRFSKFCWSWSGSVRDFSNFASPGPSWYVIFRKYLVLVRVGPRFSENICS